MSDSYHFQIEPEPAKEALFRVGGYYKQRNGDVVRLDPPLPIWPRSEREVEVAAYSPSRGYELGARRVSDGMSFPYDRPSPVYDLVPGECDEHGAPLLTGSIKFPSGSVLQVSGDKVVGRVEPAECIEDLIAYVYALATAVPAEPQRAPLPNSDAWRYTGKERDDFPEFVVTRETVIDFALPLNKPMPKGGTLHAHPGLGSALLRG